MIEGGRKEKPEQGDYGKVPSPCPFYYIALISTMALPSGAHGSRKLPGRTVLCTHSGVDPAQHNQSGNEVCVAFFRNVAWEAGEAGLFDLSEANAPFPVANHLLSA